MVDIVNYKPVPLSNLLANIEAVKYNPASIQVAVLNHLSDVTNGLIDIVDPTNPFVYLLEASSVAAAAAINQNDINTRRLYPALATTYDDLYLHMSDLDYVDRFAAPASAIFTFMLEYDKMLGAMVASIPEQCNKLIIPRNTTVTVGAITFSMEYPIVIKHLTTGALQVVFDNTVISPYSVLQSNVLDHSIVTDSNGLSWLKFSLRLAQFNISTSHHPVTNTSMWGQVISYNDSFYSARVYRKVLTQWVEMAITHTAMVLNPNVATAVLRVTPGKVSVSIPQIYIDKNMVSDTVRVDIYSTKGALSTNLANVNLTTFVSNYISYDDLSDSTPYHSAITKVTTQAYSDTNVNGGAMEVDFATLRKNVIYNATGPQVIPITNNQLIAAAAAEGFTLSRNIDSVTNRVFTASKTLPAPTNSNLITPCSLSIDTLTTTLSSLRGHGATIKVNGNRITTTPECLFRNKNGIVTIVPELQVANINSLSSGLKMDAINAGGFIYTPFYYVLDSTNNTFTSRAYTLDTPKSSNLSFISQNTTLLTQVNTSGYGFYKTKTGYLLTLVTKSDAFYKTMADKNVGAVLMYKPPNETNYVYITGVIRPGALGVDRIFDFVINSNLDIYFSDMLYMNGFNMLNSTGVTVPTTLLNTFTIVYTTDSITVGYIPGYGETLIKGLSLPKNTAVITTESVQLKFGDSLKNLWTNTNSAPNATDYVRHTVDVPMVYTADTYTATDPVLGSVLTITNGVVVYPLYHKKGDPVLNPVTNLPVMLHRVGDIVVDNNGKPMLLASADITRYIDMLFIEGVYYWANDLAHVNYRKEVSDLLDTWINVDLGLLTPRLLEQTKVFYYAKRDVGDVVVLTKDNLNMVIPAKQHFTVNYYVRNAVFKDRTAQDNISLRTIVLLDKAIKARTVSISDIINTLTTEFGKGIVSVEVSGLGGSLNLNTLTVVKDSDGLSLNKIAISLEDGTIITREDVKINYFDHELIAY